MRKPQGYASITSWDSGKIVEEYETVTCGHCNCIIPVQPGQTDTASCKKCDSHICNTCAARLARELKCRAFEAQVEALEKRDQLIRAAS